MTTGVTGDTEGSKGAPQASRRKITARYYIYVSAECGMTYRANHDSARDRTGRVLCDCKNSRCQELCLGGNWSESSIQQMRQSAAGRKEDGCVRRQGSAAMECPRAVATKPPLISSSRSLKMILSMREHAQRERREKGAISRRHLHDPSRRPVITATFRVSIHHSQPRTM